MIRGLGLSMSSPTVSLTVISTGNEELDTRLGGGLPSPSLIFIEGDNGTGKTALCTQFALGYLSSGLRVMYVITENTVRQFLSQTHNINLDLTDYFLRGQLNVVSASLGGISWVGSRVREVLDSLIKYIYAQVGRYDVFILDSLSVILHYINDEDVHTLLISLRNIVRMGKNIVITLHPGIISERLARELVAGSDVYFRLAFGEVGGRAVKVINVVKIRGSPTLAENAIAFDIDPAFGIKVVPLALAKA